MVLRKEVRESFKRFLGKIQTGRRCGWVIYGPDYLPRRPAAVLFG